MPLARNTGLILLHRKYRKYKKVFQSYAHLSAYKQLIRKPPKLHTPMSSWQYWRIVNNRRSNWRNWNHDRLAR